MTPTERADAPEDAEGRLDLLIRRLAELMKRWPESASPTPTMWREREELEEQVERLRAELSQRDAADARRRRADLGDGAPATLRDMNLAVFQGRPLPHVLFQPRMEPWYDWHRQFGGLPEAYAHLDVREAYDALGLSMRYVHYYTGMPDPVVRTFSPEVTVHEEWGEATGAVVYETARGALTEHYRRTVDGTWRKVGFPVRTLDDLRTMRWLFQNTVYTFDPERFGQGDDYVGERGVPQFWVPKSPYQALAQQWMKLPDLIYLLHDEPQEVEAAMQAIDEAYDTLYEGILANPRVRIINFGENLHEQLLSPRYVERYLLPFYNKRAGQLRRGGVYTHVHMDGYMRGFLPYLADMPFDGLEALTPQPQGDVSLEEIREHLGDKVLLDGIPAVLFMPEYSREELMAIVERVVELFHPRLVLGISDELPEGAGEEALERVALVSRWCRERTGPPPAHTPDARG